MKNPNEPKTNKQQLCYQEKINLPEMEIDFKLFNKELINEINNARENPQQYINKLEEIKKLLPTKSEKYLYIDNIPFIYQNLYSSLESAILFLKSQKKLNKLIEKEKISICCQELKENLVKNKNDINNVSNINDNKFQDRLNKYGKCFGDNYEIISYNLFNPEFIVINILLGDNDSTKLGQTILFNPEIKYIGLDSYFDNDKIFVVINFCEDFYEKEKNVNDDIINKYKNKKANFISKIILNEIRNYYLDENNDNNINNKIEKFLKNKKSKKHKKLSHKSEKKKCYITDNNLSYNNKCYNSYTKEKYNNNINIKNSNEKIYSNTYAPLKGRNKKIDNYYENEKDLKLKNDVYLNYHTFNDSYLENFDEDEFFEKEFDKNWGKAEKDKNYQKKLFTSTTTSEKGLHTTIITEIYENVKNGIKKGYFIEKEKNRNVNKINLDNENFEKEKRDLSILKEMDKREKERRKNNKFKSKENEDEFIISNKFDYFDNDEGIVDIKITKEKKVDSKGRNVVDITKNIIYDDGNVRKITRRQYLDDNDDYE